jgi:hypothetical protein
VVSEILIANYHDEAERDSVARHQDRIAHWFRGAPSGLLPADLRPGDVRFDWIVEDAYVEVMFPVSLVEESATFVASLAPRSDICSSGIDAI